MTQVHLVHGFNVKDGGRDTIGNLGPYFDESDFSVRHFSYGWIGLMGAYYLNPRIVKQLIRKVEPGDVGVAHSNGCVILLMAAAFGAPFSAMVLIQPALHPNVRIPEEVRVLVLHNERDYVVKVAAMLRLLFPWAPLGDPLWGDMGAKGQGAKDYGPEGWISRMAETAHRLLQSRPKLLAAVRILSAPFAIVYWLIGGPLEVLVTFVRNNVLSREGGNSLDLGRDEDLEFFAKAFVLPLLAWSAIGACFKYLI